MPKTFASLPPPLVEPPRLRPRTNDPLHKDNDRVSRLIAQPFEERKRAAKPAPPPTAAKPATKSVTSSSPPKKDSAYSMHVGTGSGFRRGGKTGLDKTLSHKALHDRSSFSGVSKSDRKILADVIEKHAKNVSTGSKLGYSARLSMKESLEQARQKGDLSTGNATRFKKIIDELK